MHPSTEKEVPSDGHDEDDELYEAEGAGSQEQSQHTSHVTWKGVW